MALQVLPFRPRPETPSEPEEVSDESAPIELALGGDAHPLIERWTPPVWRFCRRMLGNDEDAGDATQETLVKVLRSLDRYDPARPFSTWLFGIARNTCIDEHRRRRRRARDETSDPPVPLPSPLVDAARLQSAELLERALAELPPIYREVIVLYHYEHRKYVEIADILSLPLGTVMNRIFRARRRLRALYEDFGGEEP